MVVTRRFEEKLFSRENLEDLHRPLSSYHRSQPHKGKIAKRVVRFQDSAQSNEHNASSLHDLLKLRPGTTRYRRVMKNVELLETAVSDSEGEEFELEVEFTVEFRSPFTILFEDEDLRKKWENFLNVTEEEEANLMMLMCGQKQTFRKKPKIGEERDPTNPEHSWKSLSKYSRNSLLSYYDSPMIGVTDQMVVDFVLSSKNQKTFVLTSSKQCLLTHCVAAFYSAKAFTIKKDSTYYTTLSKTKTTQIPTILLSEFLQSKKGSIR